MAASKGATRSDSLKSFSMDEPSLGWSPQVGSDQLGPNTIDFLENDFRLLVAIGQVLRQFSTHLASSALPMSTSGCELLQGAVRSESRQRRWNRHSSSRRRSSSTAAVKLGALWSRTTSSWISVLRFVTVMWSPRGEPCYLSWQAFLGIAVIATPPGGSCEIHQLVARLWTSIVFTQTSR